MCLQAVESSGTRKEDSEIGLGPSTLMVFGVIVVVCINYLYYLILSGEKPFSTKRVLEGEIERKGVKGSKGNSTVVDNIENQSCRNG